MGQQVARRNAVKVIPPSKRGPKVEVLEPSSRNYPQSREFHEPPVQRHVRRKQRLQPFAPRQAPASAPHIQEDYEETVETTTTKRTIRKKRVEQAPVHVEQGLSISLVCQTGTVIALWFMVLFMVMAGGAAILLNAYIVGLAAIGLSIVPMIAALDINNA